MSYNPLNLGRSLGEVGEATVAEGGARTSAAPRVSAVDHAVDAPRPPKLEHMRTAPTTIPVNPVAHAPMTAHDPTDGSEHSSDLSATPTLNGGGGAVPLAAGGLHGRPMPGSKADKHGAGVVHEKDHQASTTGGKTGTEIASLAKKELGLEERDAFDEKNLRGPPSPTVAMRRIERTTSGTRMPRREFTASGADTVTGVGMVPITRKTSQPPGVGIFGGVAPSGPDAEEGFAPVRSHEEEEERELRRLEKGPDPWAVRFDEGDKANPKVSHSGA